MTISNLETIKAKGKLRYSLKKPESDQNWWLVLNCNSEEISRYYRHLYWLNHSKAQKLARPFWGSHVTLVRNEEPPNKNLWWAYENEEIEFQYWLGVEDNYGPNRYRSFYWLNVVCPRFDKIRAELGLLPNPDRIYHMTIGSSENETNRHIYEEMLK